MLPRFPQHGLELMPGAAPGTALQLLANLLQLFHEFPDSRGGDDCLPIPGGPHALKRVTGPKENELAAKRRVVRKSIKRNLVLREERFEQYQMAARRSAALLQEQGAIGGAPRTQQIIGRAGIKGCSASERQSPVAN